MPDFIKNWLLKKGLQLMLGKLWAKLDGYKMRIGGLASILTGAAMIAKDFSDGGTFTPIEGWNYILAGWALISAKSAIQKTEPK